MSSRNQNEKNSQTHLRPNHWKTKSITLNPEKPSLSLNGRNQKCNKIRGEKKRRRRSKKECLSFGCEEDREEEEEEKTEAMAMAMAMGKDREEDKEKEEEREVLYWGYLQNPSAEKKKRSGLSRRRRRVGLKLFLV